MKTKETPKWAYVFAPLVLFYILAAAPVGYLIGYLADVYERKRRWTSVYSARSTRI